MPSEKTVEMKITLRSPFFEGFQVLADYDQIVEEDRQGYFETFIEMAIQSVLQGIADEKKNFANEHEALLKVMEELIPTNPPTDQ